MHAAAANVSVIFFSVIFFVVHECNSMQKISEMKQLRRIVRESLCGK
jgi:hypothetical protein